MRLSLKWVENKCINIMTLYSTQNTCNYLPIAHCLPKEGTYILSTCRSGLSCMIAPTLCRSTTHLYSSLKNLYGDLYNGRIL